MPLELSRLPNASWTGVGFHPTPETLVLELAAKVVDAWGSRSGERKTLRVLDACAADGRLGFAVRDEFKKIGISAELTLLEVDPIRVPVANIQTESSSVDWVIGNFLDHSFQGLYDVVVSNPPYLSLDKKTASRLGLQWSRAVRGGMNLYGIAMLRALEVCQEGGVVGLIAPQGWVRNARMDALRRDVSRLASEVNIFASRSRREFHGVTQDASVQTFFRAGLAYDNSQDSKISLAYPGSELRVVGALQKMEKICDFDVRIGPFVWNREAHLIATGSTKSFPVVYGGNIAPDGEIDYSVARYEDRQHLAASELPNSYISKGPCIVVKRSMRGGPGEWQVDCAYVRAGHQFVAENHVIVICGSHPLLQKVKDGKKLASALALQLAIINRDHGHPNLSSSSVRIALSEICRSLDLGASPHDSCTVRRAIGGEEDSISNEL